MRNNIMEVVKGPVCVTGGTGFIASWLIMRLLQQGYTVRTTVRPNPEGKKRDLSYLTDLPGAPERLQILNADLNNPDSFKAAIVGCTGVFHVAHPMDVPGKIAEEVLSKTIVEGTLGILKACLDSKTVKRVVYTSSVVTVTANSKNKSEDVVDESSYTDIDSGKRREGHGTSYIIAKTETEKAALAFAEERGLDIVVINIPLVCGPFICPKLSISITMGLAMIFGYKDVYKSLVNTAMVHTDDAVRAHIFLLEYPDAKGRYICSSNKLSLIEMAQFLSARYPHFKIPTPDSLKDIEGFKPCNVSSEKLLSAGFKFNYDLGDMFDGAIQSCKEKGFL